jgi:ribosomal protein S7
MVAVEHLRKKTKSISKIKRKIVTILLWHRLLFRGGKSTASNIVNHIISLTYFSELQKEMQFLLLLFQTDYECHFIK